MAAATLVIGNLFLHKPISDVCDALFAWIGRGPYERVTLLGCAALSAGGAFATSNVHSSKSNINRFAPLNPGDQGAVQACKAGGGRPGKDLKGQTACVTSDPTAVKACTDGGGKLARDPSDDLDYCAPGARTASPSN